LEYSVDPDAPDPSLSDISTVWGALAKAHQGPAEEARAIRDQQLQRYSAAVRRYLRSALSNPDAADEVFQEFALRFVSGAFRGASPAVGSFRHYLKRTLSNLIADYYRRQRKQPAPLPAEVAVEPEANEDAADAAFTQNWREELLRRTWGALRECERATGKPFYTVLRSRVDHPDESAAQLALRIGPRLNRTVTAEWVRNRLHFARERFAEALLTEVAETLSDPTADHLERELLDLGLLEACREALQRRRR
jgi:RNA polymerase sigma-70 factor (ECF subfamily)